MGDDLRTTLTLISTQLAAIIKSVNDEQLKAELESVLENALIVLDKVNDSNFAIVNELCCGDNGPTYDQELIERALKFVDDNLQNSSYSVMQLSKDMNMDRTGLYRKLVALTGHAPTMFIRSIRLKKAVMLLNQKRYSQAEIAEKIGFSNAAYFSKCFKEEYGVSPSNYQPD
ncbi:helix-turn-helix domain-containing protein [Mucilaginibacter calamicampi]|uniref:Helix-turn-helix domain-containing protein n=1 Tax=Mucilaginibacter calamicampi TaxID=1302352 RepID=A0ABW2Z153_9SPHI